MSTAADQRPGLLSPRDAGAGTAALAVGFGTTVTMWGIGYFSRLFGEAVPAWLVFMLLLAAQLGGGWVAGYWSARHRFAGVRAGLISGLLNLLIVGSVISGDTPNSIRSGVLLWVPGTLVCSVGLAAVGAVLGRALRGRVPAREPDWTGYFAGSAVVACLLLLAAGGLVTGFDEGLAVVDWPNTEGYNMFLYPLARMTGGVLLEHSHRLLGSLVGLAVLVLAIHTQVLERRRHVQLLAWVTFGLVVIQGVLGGLRVTGRLTLSTAPAETDPKILLAIIHGVLGQLVFAALVALAVARSRPWRELGPASAAPAASTDRSFGIVLILLLIAQLVLGALVRHFTWALDTLRYGIPIDAARLMKIGQWALHIHITVAVLVTLLAVAVGVRAWGLYLHLPVLPRLGGTLLLLILVQLVLGIAAFVVTGDDAAQRRPTALDVAITTAHQVAGASLLAWAVMIVLWNYRLLRSDERGPSPIGATR
jgi:cytochrome c oxidase assembly protein subunit 15